jgi:hypothetical protein
VDGRGKLVQRDNPADFIVAADHLYQAMVSFRTGKPMAEVGGIPSADRDEIAKRLAGFTDLEGDTRHQRWLSDINAGKFSFGPAPLSYQPKGQDSWKFDALGARSVLGGDAEQYVYQSKFLSSDWKKFHDALMAHRFTVLYEILPQYGICAA